MTTLSLSNNSVSNTALLGPDGNIVYEVSTPNKVTGGTVTTISCHGVAVASIEWHSFSGHLLSFEGRQERLEDVFPTSGVFLTSRTYTTRSGESFTWKAGSDIHCISENTKQNLALYDRVMFTLFRSKKSALHIYQAGVEIMDALVVTWVIMEHFSRNRGGSAGSGSGGGGGGGC